MATLNAVTEMLDAAVTLVPVLQQRGGVPRRPRGVVPDIPTLYSLLRSSTVGWRSLMVSSKQSEHGTRAGAWCPDPPKRT
jgi:hypothetical protein